jgi:hypothetical protein
MISVKKMYVLVRLDLSESYRMVQGAHALANFALNLPASFNEWNNGTLVFLGVYGLKGLHTERIELLKRNKEFITYHESDLDDQATSIACYGDSDIEPRGPLFTHLRCV